MGFDKRLINVLSVSFAFMFTFMAFQTMGNIEKTILESVHNEDKNFNGEAYTSLAILYAVLSICNWLSPSIINMIGPKISMILGCATYLFFIMTFIWPTTWLLYFASALMGAGAALIWTGQGNYLTLSSSEVTISRNSGVFWAMLQCSMLFGNLFVYIKFRGQDTIEKDTRLTVCWTLTGLAAVGLVIFFFLPRIRKNEEDEVRVEQPTLGPVETLIGAAKLFVTPQMLLLSFTFFYSGIELGFYSGVYSSAVGFTTTFPSPNELVGLSGVFIGIGEVLGGVSFGILGSKTSKWGRDPIVIGGFVIHMLAYFLIFINLPNNSPLGKTSDKAIITSSQELAMFCSFLLGLGDACFNTQFYSILGSVYSDNSACAFGLFKFVQSIAAAATFFYASHVALYGQLGILVALGILGTASYVWVEWRLRKSRVQNNTDNSSDLST